MYLNRETYVSYVTAPEGRGFIQHQQKEREKQRKQTKDSDTQKCPFNISGNSPLFIFNPSC